MENRSIKWTISAQNQLKEIYLFIAKDSFKQADIVFDTLVNSTQKLIDMPFKYPPDKYKIDNREEY